MDSQPRITLDDTRSIPQIGLGVWQTPPDVAGPAVKAALGAGYRMIDTATMYGNERGVGEGVRASGVPREDVFVTTKLWNDAQGFDSALRAFDESLDRLGLEAIDLYLIHWPSPRRGLYLETWRALVRLREERRAKSIGVSNFGPDELQRIIGETGVTPVLNQVELHPRFQQRKLREVHARLGIVTECWSPLGRGALLADRAIGAIAKKYARTPAQVIIRWHIDSGLIVIPKSVTPAGIVENIDVFSFQLDDSDMAAIAALDSANGRMGPDPATAGF